MMRRRRRWGLRETVVVIAMLALTVAAALLASPRATSRTGPGARRVLRSIPLARLGAVVTNVATEPPSATRGKRPLMPDAAGRLPVPVTDEMPQRFPAEGAPPGWEVWEFTGHANVELVRSEIGPALRMKSEGTSFALYRNLAVDLAEFPWLSWAWKVMRLPAGGDVRERRFDDEAGQVYLVFPRWPSPRTQSDVIGYVWDTTAPVGTRLTSPKAGNVKVVVVASGRGALNTWQRFERNVAQDYEAVFGHQPPRVGLLALMTDANDTASATEILVADVAFRKTPR